LIGLTAKRRKTKKIEMNFKHDLKKAIQDHMRKKSTKAQLRKRSMDSVARPRAKQNILSNNKDLQGI
jgi:hypothetical protein